MFTLETSGEVSLDVYDLLGRHVEVLARGPYPAGPHKVRWDGRSEKGQIAPSGVYLYQLQAGSFKGRKSMILLR